MTYFPVFISIVFVVRNRADHLDKLIKNTIETISPIVSDYELIVVDNASTDKSVALLKSLTLENGYPNLQVYALTKQVDTDTASWAGLENALGDYTAVVDPFAEDIQLLPKMLESAESGADVVFAKNEVHPTQGMSYRLAYFIFNKIYKWFSHIDLLSEAPQYRLLSKKVVHFILQHSQPALTYRHLPATGGFSRVNLKYNFTPQLKAPKSLREGVDRGMRLLISTTRAPMRLVTSLSLFGAGANFIYSIYVVSIGVFKKDVAPGWLSLSLQQSGMFFLISLVLLILGEYILNMASLSNEGPPYHIAQEFTSARITRREKLNIENAESRPSRSKKESRGGV